ncbi:BON1-associated protein 2-like isoform X2 [Arachis stenosperma]|uniref:BON1-associated protein 2-like isoform X2 n=1 Tax=Arachis stenosperma TaxID=217475 RepID=UPI0025ABDFC8|nr:BON1-associated protein 2-like isoform X2 [Arachis stenosperma]
MEDYKEFQSGHVSSSFSTFNLMQTFQSVKSPSQSKHHFNYYSLHMESRTSSLIPIELTILNAENLIVKGKPLRRNNNNNNDAAYIVVHAQCSSTKHYPSWNEKFSMEVEPATCRFISIEVRRKKWLGYSSESVAMAHVPVSELFGAQFLSYRLWDKKGDRNGIIDFSLEAAKRTEQVPMRENEEPVMGFHFSGVIIATLQILD